MTVDEIVPSRTLLNVRSKYLAALERLPLPLADYGRRLLSRLGPDRWSLEWSLPVWLGSALHISSELSTELVLCNVLGLAYVRIQDDLADGEVPEQDRSSAVLLAHSLYTETILRYLDLFDRASHFWDYFRRYLDEWVSATVPGGGARPSALNDESLIELAHRGAPLKICCAAAFLLADRPGEIAPAALALDHTLGGIVLLDHLRDWTEDLDSGRQNAFVAFSSSLDQDAVHRDDNWARVLAVFLDGDSGRPYLDAILASLERASRTDLAGEVPEFDLYLTDLQARATAYYESCVEEYRVLLRETTDRLFRPASRIAGRPADEKGG